MNHDPQTNVSEGRKVQNAEESESWTPELGESQKPPTAIETARFWRKVDKNGPIIYSHLGPCWHWTGHFEKRGYGRCGFRRKSIYCHRLAYFFLFGEFPLPNGLHKCYNPKCVNPHHIYAGTHRDNALDAFVRRRRASGEQSRFSKLKESEVVCMRILFNSGSKTITDMAKFFGVSLSAACAATSGDNWAYIDEEHVIKTHLRRTMKGGAA